MFGFMALQPKATTPRYHLALAEKESGGRGEWRSEVSVEVETSVLPVGDGARDDALVGDEALVFGCLVFSLVTRK
jgi:hypothetical protein